MTAKINRLMNTVTALRANHLAAFFGRGVASTSWSLWEFGRSGARSASSWAV